MSCLRLPGWDLVPETVDRADGPLGDGSLQRFVPADFEQHYYTLIEDEANHDRLTIDLRIRCRRKQRRPQKRPLPPRRGRENLGDRQRVVLPRRARSCRTASSGRFAGDELPAEAVTALTKLADGITCVSRLSFSIEARDRRRQASLGDTAAEGQAPRGLHEAEPHYPWPLV